MVESLQSAVIYCRISKDELGTFKGVERQKEDCLALAQARGFTVSEVYIDNDVSPYNGAVRPQYRRMLAERSDRKPAVIIAWHTDRLHRHPRELEEFIDLTERNGTNSLTVKAGEIDLSTASGRAVARTLGAWARFESEHKSDRIQRKKLELAKEGAYVGGPIPYGYMRRPEKKLGLHPVEAPEVAEAFRKFLNGASLGSLVRDFNDRGLVTRRNLQWNSTAMRNMLKRATYAGKSTHRGKVIGDAQAPAIVSEADWLASSLILTDPAQRTNVESKVRRLLVGILECGECGAPMKGSTRSSKVQIQNKDYYKARLVGKGTASKRLSPSMQ
ncbi:recombinase family protein [Glutamicibacter arilaitensis]|uniref:recombinase family protein n=1 Tax=Glutamicibacter arilaitensis TaxID=256701 RepID=UPI00384F5525